MRIYLYLLSVLIQILVFGCSTTKTKKVYIEVGVNDYTRTREKPQNGELHKSKKLEAGMHHYQASGTQSKSTKTKNPH